MDQESLKPCRAVVVLALAAHALGGCSSSDAKGGGAGAAGGSAGAQVATGGSSGGVSAGSAGQGGGSSGSQSTGGGGSSGAAALWSRASATCTSLGEDCSQCGTDTVCYLSPPNVCVPHGSGFRCAVGSCSADTPYCIDDFCMNLNDASCFCTADPGKTIAGCLIAPADHLAANMKANECHAQDTACGTDMVRCCDGTTCAGFGTAPATCIKICSSGADCASGCCVPLTGSTSMICGPAGNCQ
jgi:hypothetical protein